MRNMLITATLALVLALPSVAQADGRARFFFGIGNYGTYRHGGYYSHKYPYSYGYYRPQHGGYYGRYAVPRVYSPYRYGDYRGDRLGLYGYKYDHAYRRAPYAYDHAYRRGLHYDRGYYYGPAVERYHRTARDYPSYHYERRERYNRGSDRSYRDRGDRYR